MLTSSDWWHSVGGSLFKIGLIINRSVDARAAFWDVCVLAAPHGGKTTIWLGWNHNSVSKFHQMSGLIIQCLAVQLHLTTVCTSPSYWPLRVFYLKSNAGCCLVSSCHLCRLFKSHYHCSIITSYLDDIKASRFYNLERYRFHGFPKKPQNCLSSPACTGQNQCRMQRELVEEKGGKKKKKKKGVGSWTAAVHVGMRRLSGGAVHWDIGALLPGRRPVPVLALYHRKLFLPPKLGRRRTIWWNSPTGHLCDKWIKLDKVMPTAIGLAYEANPKSRRQNDVAFFFLNVTLWSPIVLRLSFYSFDFWATTDKWIGKKKKKISFVKLQRKKHISYKQQQSINVFPTFDAIQFIKSK